MILDNPEIQIRIKNYLTKDTFKKEFPQGIYDREAILDELSEPQIMQPTFLPQQRTQDRESGKKIKAAGVQTQTKRQIIKTKGPFDIREEEKKTEQVHDYLY